MIFFLSCQREITKEIFKIAFPRLISTTNIKNPPKRDNLKYSPFNILVNTIIIYIFTTKVKAHEENLVHKLRSYPKESLLLCCTKTVKSS